MPPEYIRVTASDRSRRAEVSALYARSFPVHERVQEEVLWQSLSQAGHELYAVEAAGIVVAFYTTIATRAFNYLLYFAVAPSRRGQGLGGQVLRHLLATERTRPWILDIERVDASAPNAAERQARLDFYRHYGFRQSGLCSTWQGGEYEILIAGGTITAAELSQFRRDCGI